MAVGGAGFEPAKAKPTDLQSVLVDRLSIPPTDALIQNTSGACGGIRTPGQLITNQLLWPAELHRQIVSSIKKEQPVFLTDCKCIKILNRCKQRGLIFFRPLPPGIFLSLFSLSAAELPLPDRLRTQKDAPASSP